MNIFTTIGIAQAPSVAEMTPHGVLAFFGVTRQRKNADFCTRRFRGELLV